MKIPGALAALALLAATSLAIEGAEAEETRTKSDAEAEVIDTIADVTRYDAALGDRPLPAAKPKKPAKPARDKSDKKTKVIKPDARSAANAGKGSITPVKAGSDESPIIVKEETARAIAEDRKVDALSLDANGAAAKPVTAQPASMRINVIRPAIILPGDAANGHEATNGHHATLQKAAQKAAEQSGGKIIEIQRRSSRTRQRLPEVVRGVVPHDDEESRPAAAPPEAHYGWSVTSGRNFWFYNEAEGLLIGCRLVGTAKVGDNKRIKCTRPRHAPDFQ